MSSTLIFAAVAMVLALVFYTSGVIGERKSKSLNKVHVLLFWLGFISICIGIYFIGKIVQSNVATTDVATSMLQSLVGMIAVFIMLFHCVWATWALIRNNESQQKIFHKFSLIIWIVWLVPYVISIMLVKK